MVDVHTGEQVDVRVAGRAMHRPVLGQLLVGREDLFDDDPRPHERLVQSLEVFTRIGEAVGMVDAQAIDAAVAREAADQSVRRLEHGAVLDAHAREIGDLEEAAIVDLVRGDAPVREAVVLLLQYPVQRHRILDGAGFEAAGALRVQREAVIEVAHAPAPALALQLELARFQRLAVVSSEHRQ